MTEKQAVNDKVLHIDLTSGRVDDVPVPAEDRRRYLGGKGLAVKMLYDRLAVGVDPLSPDNVLVMMTGPTAGTPSPAGGRFAVVCKSPLTGIMASSYVGGRFGVSLKRAGYDGLMIEGRAESPAYVSIDEGKVEIRDAGDLWGTDTQDLQAARKEEGDWVVIGPAGENLVRFSVIASGRRVAGRCGMGAVMGSKNLKGVVAKGGLKFGPADPALYEKALKVAQRKVQAHAETGDRLRSLGTPQNIRIFGEAGITPVRNYGRIRFDKREEISAEKIRDEHFLKNHGCPGCTIQCGRTGKFGGRELVSPEYETIGMMGSNLTVADLEKIAVWNDKLNRLGIDSISMGNILGFAMELTEKGMLDSPLAFGRADGIDEIIDDVAYRRGLGDDLAEGVRRLSAKYGGEDFAIHVKGLEMAAYDPRGCSGQGLGYATANAGATHLSGSTHAIEAESYLDPHDCRGKAHFVKFMQDLTDAINSSIFCIQTEYPFLEENFAYKHTPMPIMRFFMRRLPALAVATTDLSDYCRLMSGLLGYKIDRKTYYEAGERIFNLDRHMNCREGISRADDTLPRRILTEAREPGEPLIDLETMLGDYYRLRGWDESGRPTPETLGRLGIEARD